MRFSLFFVAAAVSALPTARPAEGAGAAPAPPVSPAQAAEILKILALSIAPITYEVLNTIPQPPSGPHDAEKRSANSPAVPEGGSAGLPIIGDFIDPVTGLIGHLPVAEDLSKGLPLKRSAEGPEDLLENAASAPGKLVGEATKRSAQGPGDAISSITGDLAALPIA